MLGVIIILSNVMRTGFMLRDKIQNEMMLSDIVIRGMMSSKHVSMLKDILLSVIIANVEAPCCDDISNKNVTFTFWVKFDLLCSQTLSQIQSKFTYPRLFHDFKHF